MNVQYISDSTGNTTGVYIPINEWNELKNKYKDIEVEELADIPEWHKEIVLQRLEQYKKDGIALDFDDVIRDIEKSV